MLRLGLLAGELLFQRPACTAAITASNSAGGLIRSIGGTMSDDRGVATDDDHLFPPQSASIYRY